MNQGVKYWLLISEPESDPLSSLLVSCPASGPTVDVLNHKSCACAFACCCWSLSCRATATASSPQTANPAVLRLTTRRCSHTYLYSQGPTRWNTRYTIASSSLVTLLTRILIISQSPSLARTHDDRDQVPSRSPVIVTRSAVIATRSGVSHKSIVAVASWSGIFGPEFNADRLMTDMRV